ncbi:MAG: polysaccharide biosynthesis protein [Bdellovibrionales bacterium]
MTVNEIVRILNLPNILKRYSPRRFSWKHLMIDAVLIVASLFASLWLRLGEAQIDQHIHTLYQLAAGFVVIRLLVFLGFGVYQSLWRYISAHDASRLILAVGLSVPLMISVTYTFRDAGYLPRSFFIIDALVCTALLLGIRLARRQVFEMQMRPQKGQVSLGKLVIYGAGQNGRLLAQRLLSDPHRDRDLLGFIDDDPEKRDRRIQGLPVLGGHADMENVLERAGCTELVVAITDPPASLMRDLVLLGRKLNIRIQRIAHFDAAQILSRTEALYRQIELKDLLKRPSSQVDLPSVKGMITDKIVLVTGAGGSIGSELCRQIARLSPAKLLLLDHSEFNLYEIDRELRPSPQDFSHIIPLLVDIKDRYSLENVFRQYRPQVVFHAAAYKHVHLVEANIASAVLNNILGTWNLLDLCERSAGERIADLEHSVERFVMISSDKAVNPVGAMGATKRVCELLTSLVGFRTQRLYSSVRFGNVLGSSGSLIPLLRKQIEEGGPVTLTHPDMTRYFMLIPEAVSLVLMSATLSQPGDINVLKMGEPIRILELARSLMALMGKSEEEIGIVFTGVRPGEKMYEELYLTGDELTTRHPDILTVPRGDLALSEPQVRHADLLSDVKRLLRMAEQGDPQLLETLKDMAQGRAGLDRIRNPSPRVM